MVSQSQRIQSLLAIVSPSYTDAVSGKTHLLKSGVLEKGDRGFDVLSEVFIGLLAKENAPESLKGVNVVRFTRLANSIRLPGSGSDDEVGLAIDVALSNGQVIHWSSAALEKRIMPLKDRGIVLFSSMVFIVGILIQILSRYQKAS